MRRFADLGALRAAVGEHLGYSDWITIDQQRVDRFAEATEDRQWIHVDPTKAADGPFGTTIAHGYLMLSLIPVLTNQVYAVDGVRVALNYGLNRVRFPAPAPVASLLRAGVEALDVSDVPGGGQVTNRVTLACRGAEKPCCVAETVVRLLA